MTEIYLHYFFQLFIFAFFIVVGILAFFKDKKAFINITLSIIFVSVGIYNLVDFIRNYPNFRDILRYQQNFEELEIENIKSSKVNTLIVNSIPKRLEKNINNEKLNAKIFLSLKYNNKSRFFSRMNWKVISIYEFEIFTTKNEIFSFKIHETSDDRSIVYLIFNNKGKKKTIGKYKNNSLKSMDILNFNSTLENWNSGVLDIKK